MKDIKKILIVSLIMVSIFGSGVSSASAATVNVDSGLNNTQIQAIIDNANSGDTIQFLGSEYDDIALVINKTLNLVGANTGTVIKAITNTSNIPAAAKNLSVSNTAAFYFLNNSYLLNDTNTTVYVSGDNCNISGFNITTNSNNFTTYTSLIYATHVLGLNIVNNSLSSSTWGIYSYICPEVKIINNTANNFTNTGILAFGSAEAYIANNTVSNAANHGIDVRHGLGYNATVTGNTITNADEGIYLMHSAGHNVYNNTISNCTLSSITAYGAADCNIYNNTMKNSFVGVLLASGFENINITNNTYALKQTSFPPTFPYYILIADSTTNSKTTSSGVFSDSASQYSNISLSTSFANNSITNGQSTTYTVKISNLGNSSASNITINSLLPSGNYTDYKIQAVSRGTFNKTSGTWNLDNLNANSDAIIVFTVTAKKSGASVYAPSVNYTDNNGANYLVSKNNSLKINKDIKTSYGTSVSATSVPKFKNVLVTVALKNTGLDTSNTFTVKNKVSSFAYTVVNTSQPKSFTYKNGTWTGKVASKQTVTLKMVLKVNHKGTFTLPISINGKVVKNYTIKGK
jgi:uncharacterized repeat protein (TIGR01451 family)